MMFPQNKRNAASSGRRTVSAVSIIAIAGTLVLAGCGRDEESSRVAGWSMVDPTQRHPIMVTQQPTTLAIRVSRGSYGMSPQQRAQVSSFVERYRAIDAGNSRMTIEVPSGSSNEVASMQAVAEIRGLLSEIGFKASDINIEAVQSGGDSQAPIRISYARYVAEGPQCGKWPTNLASSDSNLNYPNLGCANQANFAAMVANPADLVTPRSSTPRVGDRENMVWEKYVKGESTISTKSGDEKVQTKGN
jgi:pilus assembly protein CpaD